MKKAVTVALLSLMSVQALAALVKSAELDESKTNLLIDVFYAGGCGDHEFSLNIEGCLETFPPMCRALLVHKTKDTCDQVVTKTIVISLQKSGLAKPYYKSASLRIIGDIDWSTGQPTHATVDLP